MIYLTQKCISCSAEEEFCGLICSIWTSVCMCSLKLFSDGSFLYICQFFENSLHFSDSRESQRVMNDLCTVRGFSYVWETFCVFNVLEQQQALLCKNVAAPARLQASTWQATSMIKINVLFMQMKCKILQIKYKP